MENEGKFPSLWRKIFAQLNVTQRWGGGELGEDERDEEEFW
jgi:hypothetical protein